MLVNALRAHMAELGDRCRQGNAKIDDLIAVIEDGEDGVPEFARSGAARVAQLRAAEAIAATDARSSPGTGPAPRAGASRRSPGSGSVTASAITATVPDPSLFRSGREFAAWLGLVPRQHSTGGKERLGRISKQGDRYIRRLLVIGATTMLRSARANTAPMETGSRSCSQAARSCRHGRAGQQNGAYRLGVARPWRDVSSAPGGRDRPPPRRARM